MAIPRHLDHRGVTARGPAGHTMFDHNRTRYRLSRDRNRRRPYGNVTGHIPGTDRDGTAPVVKRGTSGFSCVLADDVLYVEFTTEKIRTLFG